jgi:hypothetical protein
VEDGLNTLQHCDMAWYDNRGHFKLKVFLSRKCNLIFVQNGYGKYCLDMEVNDISVLKRPCDKYVEVNRQKLLDALKQEDKELILQAFIRDKDSLQKQLEDCGEQNNKILILTEPLCDLDTRETIFRDIIEKYQKEGKIFIKPHPRDLLNYRERFAEYPQFDATVPMEMLNFFPGLRFKKVVGVLTETSGIQFADEAIRLGPDFLDKYEDPSKHDHSKV